MRLLVRQGVVPEIVTSDGEVVEDVRMIQVRHEAGKPVTVTIEFTDREATKCMWHRVAGHSDRVPGRPPDGG